MRDSKPSDPAITEAQGGKVTTLFQLRQQDDGRATDRWSLFSNVVDEERQVMRQVANDPIIHRMSMKEGKWITHSFAIHSPAMRSFLRFVLQNYHDFDPELESWIFSPPYKPLVHRWARLMELSKNPEYEAETNKDVVDLVAFLTPILQPQVRVLENISSTGRILFNNMWQIFSPNELVITKFYGADSLCRVVKCERSEPGHPDAWYVYVRYIDWNGARCGYRETMVKIPSFTSLQNINSLAVYPLKFHESEDTVKEQILARGRLFEQMRGFHFRTCVGTAITLSDRSERPVSGRVIVDAFAYHHAKQEKLPSLKSLDAVPSKPEPRKEETISPSKVGPWGPPTYSSPGGLAHPRAPGPPQGWEPRMPPPMFGGAPSGGLKVVHVKRPKSQRNRSSSSSSRSAGSTGSSSPSIDGKFEQFATVPVKKLEERTEDLTLLTDDQCLLTTPWVIGFDLKAQIWARFRVDELSPIVWNEEAYTSLILPDNEKELAWKFVKNKTLANNTFDDFVEQKGRGIIILMFGPPGVGKTFTAEAVAERARVPLLNLSAATLGTEPKEVEKSLETCLGMCKLWNAMLLLDEADVFLASRTDTDLARNELVAVFLTKLEYYQGICFMTTNRMASLDHAMQSRVDLFLQYTDLTEEARRQVWQNFINKTGAEQFLLSESELGELSKLKLNGREIKNLIKTAHLISLSDDDKRITLDKLTMLADNRARALAALANA